MAFFTDLSLIREEGQWGKLYFQRLHISGETLVLYDHRGASCTSGRRSGSVNQEPVVTHCTDSGTGRVIKALSLPQLSCAALKLGTLNETVTLAECHWKIQGWNWRTWRTHQTRRHPWTFTLPLWSMYKTHSMGLAFVFLFTPGCVSTFRVNQSLCGSSLL